MHRRAIAYLFLLIFLSFSWGSAYPEEKHSWAVCIDLNAFEGHEFGEEIKKALIAGEWKESHVKVVKQNSSDAFFDALEWLKNNAKEEDTILFYFSGHGYNGGVDIGMEKISYAQLNEKLDEISCKGMLIVIDACHSGSSIPFIKKDGRVVITSCHGDETSGYFSEAFINALGIASDCNGNLDGRVSAEEIFSYIMGDWYIESYTPQINDFYEGDLSILSAHWKGRKVDVYQTHAQRNVENFGGERWLRQSFVALSTPVCGISLKIARWKNATDAYIEIYDEDFNFVGGTVLPAAKANDADGIPTWVSIGMDVDVIPGKKYFLVCKSNATWWWWGSGDWYENGKASVSYDGGNSWQSLSKISDFGFIIYGEDDMIPPEVSLFYPNGGEILSKVIPIAWNAVDNNDSNLDGSIAIFYSRDGKIWNIIAEGIENNGVYEWNSTSMEDGEYLIKVTATDDSGNEGKDVSDGIFIIDNTPPETICEVYGERGKNNWYVNKTTIMLSSHDAFSSVFVYYKINKQWKEYTKPIVLSKDGKHEFSYYGEDVAGNREKGKKTIIKIDSTPPNISFLMPEEKYLYFGEKKILPLAKNTIIVGKTVIKVKAEDETSNISNVKFFIDGEQTFVDKEEPYEWMWNKTTFFKHEIKSIAYDSAGNHAQVKQILFSFTF